MHPSFFFAHSHYNYKPYTSGLFTYPPLGVEFSSRAPYLCSEFPRCIQPTCTAPTSVIYLSVTFCITSPHFQFSFLLTKWPCSNLVQLPACSRWSIAAADGGALPSPAQSLGAVCSMFTTTMNATPILSTSAGASYIGKHHLRLGSMGKTKRRLSDARESSGSDVRFCFFLYLCLFFCVNFLCVGACFLAFRCCSQSSFSLDCLSLVWSRCHSRMSCVLLLCFVSLFSCYYLHLSPNNIWFFDVCLIYDHSCCSIPCYVINRVMIYYLQIHFYF